jgi:hypothetical protein
VVENPPEEGSAVRRYSDVRTEGTADMDDTQVQHRINSLAEVEERLWSRGGEEGGLTTEDEARLHELQVQLDQAYDLLAQRRARRAAGLDPDGARLRPADVVENYQQ